ncbi:MAG: hypothetical protein ACYSUM_21365 [Planctomycetota bacterium]|jgi:hypothetical protein
MQRRNPILLTVAALVALAAVVVAGDTITVSQVLPHGWSYENFGTTASHEFVTGPGTPPAGAGSVAFSQASFGWEHGGTLHTSRFNGTRLDEITELKYSTYARGSAGSFFQSPYVQLMLDLDGDGAFDDRIVFEPSWQTGGRAMTAVLHGVRLDTANTVNVQQNGLGSTRGSTTPNQWFDWDLLIGSWWTIPGPGSLLYPDVGIGQSPLVTIAGILEAFPNAKIVDQAGNAINTGGVRLQYGFGGVADQYVGHVDKFVITTTAVCETHDFEKKTIREAKEDLLDALEALLPTDSKQDDKKVGVAIDRLERSLDDDYWDTDATVNTQKVFEDEKKAVHELLKVSDGPDALASIIDDVALADRALAQKAIDDAIAASGTASDIAKAQAQMEDAADDLADGDPDKAIEHYEHAWNDAQRAMK